MQSITKFDGTDGITAKFGAVTGDTKENKSFWNATPSGQIEVYVTNPKAVEQLELGKNYYVDFTVADD
ncbi:hypothetical protein ACE1AT_11450 [Pelatocladus sp. BLCC-F211]